MNERPTELSVEINDKKCSGLNTLIPTLPSLHKAINPLTGMLRGDAGSPKSALNFYRGHVPPACP